jgi:hypothetical protein
MKWETKGYWFSEHRGNDMVSDILPQNWA